MMGQMALLQGPIAEAGTQAEDLRILAELDAKGNVKPLFPRIG